MTSQCECEEKGHKREIPNCELRDFIACNCLALVGLKRPSLVQRLLWNASWHHCFVIRHNTINMWRSKSWLRHEHELSWARLRQIIFFKFQINTLRVQQLGHISLVDEKNNTEQRRRDTKERMLKLDHTFQYTEQKVLINHPEKFSLKIANTLTTLLVCLLFCSFFSSAISDTYLLVSDSNKFLLTSA